MTLFQHVTVYAVLMIRRIFRVSWYPNKFSRLTMPTMIPSFAIVTWVLNMHGLLGTRSSAWLLWYHKGVDLKSSCLDCFVKFLMGIKLPGLIWKKKKKKGKKKTLHFWIASSESCVWALVSASRCAWHSSHAFAKKLHEVQAYRRVGAVGFFQQVIEGHLNCVYAKMFGAFVLIRGHFLQK